MADDKPLAIDEESQTKHESDHSCPFCTIVSHYPPTAVSDTDNLTWEPERLSPPTFVLFSTAHVVAFLDIAPLTRGHVLLCPRNHRTRIGDLTAEEAASIGRVLPLVARAVLSATFPDIPSDEADYNVVQNNGPGAAQVIPHVHFHIIPRPPLDYKPSKSTSQSSKVRYAPAKIPTGLKASYIQFGRGQRHELDEDDAAELVKQMREQIKQQWHQDLESTDRTSTRRDQKL